MSEIKYGHIGVRLREERLRVGVSQVDFASHCGTSRNALLQWERGETAPNAGLLSSMTSLGIDVLYVVTGQRQGETEATLAPEEKALLTAWRSSGEKGRTALAAVAEVLKPE